MKYPILVLIFIGCIWSANLNAQQADSLKLAHIDYLGKTLSVSQSKAKAVFSILDDYKVSAMKVISDASLTENTRREKLNQLIDDRNSKLKKELTEQQLQKIVPSHERH